jgi:hypothetical protein
VRVLAVGQGLARRVAGDVQVHEVLRVAEDLVEDPRQILLRAMLEHVGAHHAVEPAFGQRAVRRVRGIEAAHLVHVPVLGDAVGDVAAVDHDFVRAVLHSLPRSVVEDGSASGGIDQALDLRDVRGKALAGERLLRRNAEARLPLDVHAAVEREELAVACARVGSAVRSHRINSTA